MEIYNFYPELKYFMNILFYLFEEIIFKQIVIYDQVSLFNYSESLCISSLTKIIMIFKEV